jgi:hypothetical protein
VVHADRRYELDGILVARPDQSAHDSLDDRRRSLEIRVSGGLGWAWTLNDLGDRIMLTSDVIRDVRRLLARPRSTPDLRR